MIGEGSCLLACERYIAINKEVALNGVGLRLIKFTNEGGSYAYY